MDSRKSSTATSSKVGSGKENSACKSLRKQRFRFVVLYNPGYFKKHLPSLILKPSLFPGHGERLAGKAAAEDIKGRNIFSLYFRNVPGWDLVEVGKVSFPCPPAFIGRKDADAANALHSQTEPTDSTE